MEDQSISIFPEKRIIYANFGYRFVASLIDGVVLSISGLLIQTFIGGANILTETVARNILASIIVGFLLNTLIGWAYFAAMESSASQATLGKQALGLIVTDINGGRISFARATGRHFGKWVSVLTLFIGYLMNAWDDKGQTLHDKMAGTLVVKK